MTHRRPSRSGRALAAVAAGALLLLACGGDDDDAADTTSVAGTETTVAAPTTVAGTDPGAATTAPSDSSAPTAGSTPAGGDALSVVLLIGGPSTDGGFYQAMVDGLQNAADSDGAMDVTVRDNLATGGDASLENAVREAAASGEFDLIVAHGFDLVPAVAKFAPEYPDQEFAASLPVEGNPPNVAAYLSIFEQIGYNAGFLAAQGTTADKVGFIGGPGLDFEKQAENGFRQAVAEYAPDATVSVVYTGTFEDPQLAQETATQMIADGVDSIWNQQAAGQSGVYTACAAAPEVNCFGNSEYSEAVSPDVVLASTVSNYEILVPQWAERLRAGAWEIGPDFLDLENGGTTITDATAAGSAKLPDLQGAIDDFRAQAESGGITVETGS
jgi:basic membrane protein A